MKTDIKQINKNKNKQKNGKITFFRQGQPVHFDYLFFAHYFLFSTH